MEQGVTNTGGTLSNNGTFNSDGSYGQSGGLTVNNGTLSVLNQFRSVDIHGGILMGTGTINAPLTTVSSGAILSPGDVTTMGRLTINGNLQSSGNLMFRIGGLNSGQLDVLAIHGMAFLNGGTVGFNFVNFAPVAGNSWDFLYANAISGWNTLTFASSGLGANQTAQFSYANGVETLRIVSVPEPASVILLGAGLAGIAIWNWRRKSTES